MYVCVCLLSNSCSDNLVDVHVRLAVRLPRLAVATMFARAFAGIILFYIVVFASIPVPRFGEPGFSIIVWLTKSCLQTRFMSSARWIQAAWAGDASVFSIPCTWPRMFFVLVLVGVMFVVTPERVRVCVRVCDYSGVCSCSCVGAPGHTFQRAISGA